MDQQDTRQAILEKFQELASVLGFKRTTVELLAKKCGISKKTVYEHFKDKRELVRCAADSVLDDVRQKVRALDRDVEDPLEKLNLLFDLSLALAADIPQVLMVDIKQFFPQVQNDVDELLKEISASSVDSLKKGMEMGLFKNINPRFVVSFVNGAASAVLNTDCLLDAQMTAGEAMTGFREMVLTGLINTELF